MGGIFAVLGFIASVLVIYSFGKAGMDCDGRNEEGE